jgi:alpha-1,3/alpha-1,6-mannosyltransferase
VDALCTGQLTPCGAPFQNEHFGMVPLEAMAAQRAVVACASGGPMESIVEGVTGYLCAPTPAAFADAAARLLQDPAGAPLSEDT